MGDVYNKHNIHFYSIHDNNYLSSISYLVL